MIRQVANVEYESLPHKLKKKIMNYYDQQQKKHPGISDERIMEKIGKKWFIKFSFT